MLIQKYYHIIVSQDTKTAGRMGGLQLQMATTRTTELVQLSVGRRGKILRPLEEQENIAPGQQHSAQSCIFFKVLSGHKNYRLFRIKVSHYFDSFPKNSTEYFCCFVQFLHTNCSGTRMKNKTIIRYLLSKVLLFFVVIDKI